MKCIWKYFSLFLGGLFLTRKPKFKDFYNPVNVRGTIAEQILKLFCVKEEVCVRTHDDANLGDIFGYDFTVRRLFWNENRNGGSWESGGFEIHLQVKSICLSAKGNAVLDGGKLKITTVEDKAVKLVISDNKNSVGKAKEHALFLVVFPEILGIDDSPSKILDYCDVNKQLLAKACIYLYRPKGGSTTSTFTLDDSMLMRPGMFSELLKSLEESI